MTCFLLARHAHTDETGKILSGRRPVGLSADGRRQARALALRLGRRRSEGLYCSPQRRALETIAPLAERLGMPVRTMPEVDEIGFGAWTGRTFAELRDDPVWQQYNRDRSAAAPPGGEHAGAVQTRFWRALQGLHDAHPKGRVIVVSHADPILYVVLRVLDAPLASVTRLELPVAGIVPLRWTPQGVHLEGPGRIAFRESLETR